MVVGVAAHGERLAALWANCSATLLHWGPSVGRPRSVLYLVDSSTGCHLWQGACSWNGYPRIKRDNRLQWAHRWYYEQEKGPIPEGLDLDHLCRTPRCVNPDHLEPVTKAENQRRGTSVRLSWDDVQFIREHHQEFTHRQLGRMFGVTHAAIQKVIHNRSWRDDPVVAGGQ